MIPPDAAEPAGAAVAEIAGLRRKVRVLLLALAIFAVAAAAMSVRMNRLALELEREKRRSAIPEGALLPPLRLTDQDGATVDTGELRGAPLLLVFAAPGCPACHERVLGWRKLAEELTPRGLLAVAVLREGEAGETDELVKKLGPAFRVCRDVEDPSVLALYRGTSVPRSYLADRWGMLLASGSPMEPLEPRHARELLLARYPELGADEAVLAVTRRVFPDAAKAERMAWPEGPTPELGRWAIRATDAGGATLGAAAVIEQDLKCPVCHDLLAVAGVDREGKVAAVALLRRIEVAGSEVDAKPMLERLHGAHDDESIDGIDGISGATKSSRALRDGVRAMLKAVAALE